MLRECDALLSVLLIHTGGVALYRGSYGRCCCTPCGYHSLCKLRATLVITSDLGVGLGGAVREVRKGCAKGHKFKSQQCQ
jgi:hypothetical protein